MNRETEKEKIYRHCEASSEAAAIQSQHQSPSGLPCSLPRAQRPPRCAPCNDNKFKIKIGNLEINSRVSLAPMAGITDTILRMLIRDYSEDCLLTTEMLSSEALCQRLDVVILEAKKEEQPLAYQISGHKPDVMLKAAKILEPRADIIDINMGCPVNKVVKGNDGAALMKTPELAYELVKTLKDNISKPITVKFRLGYDNNNKNYIEFGQLMQKAGADAITLHGRTRAQMYHGKADWEAIGKFKQNIDIPVFANGDIIDVKAAIECREITNADGFAIARGALGNPFLIKQTDHYFKTGELLPDLTLSDKIELIKKHLHGEMALRGELYGIKFMRKFYAYYIRGIKNAAGYRGALVVEEDYDAIIKILDEILKNG